MESSKKIKLIFSPETDSNQYLENTIKILSSINGLELDLINKIKFSRVFTNFRRYDFAVISWLENALVSNKKSISLKSLLKFLFKYLFFCLISKKIVYVRHNIYPHALHGTGARIARLVIDILCAISYKTVVHSGHLASKSVIYIPHPLYKVETSITQNIIKDRFIIFGRVVPYKSINKLLEVWQSRHLLIAGSVGDENYLQGLIEITKDQKLTNVVFDTRFISNAEAQLLVMESLGLILTHSEEDMIVSGSFFFAATLGVPIYALKTPFLMWLQQSFSYPNLYLFENLNDMVRALDRVDYKIDDRLINLSTAEKLFGDAVIKAAWEKILLVSV